MSIANITFLNAEKSAARIDWNDDRPPTTVPWPCTVWLREQIDEWLGQNNEVGLFSPTLTIEQFSGGVSAMLDARAKERQYDNAISLVSYADSTNEVWAAEASAFIAMRDAVWAYALEQLAMVRGGRRSAPDSVAVFVGEVATECPLIWPSE